MLAVNTGSVERENVRVTNRLHKLDFTVKVVECVELEVRDPMAENLDGHRNVSSPLALKDPSVRTLANDGTEFKVTLGYTPCLCVVIIKNERN